jgi:sugar lactone lactonase YvrE
MRKVSLLTIMMLFLTACSTPQAVSKERYFWPPPPDVARIEWLKSYSSQLDIDKTPVQQFWAAIAGEDAPKSLHKPVEVKSVPEQQKFFVSDLARAAIVVFDLAGHEQRILEVPANAPQLMLPLSIAVDSQGQIYVLERRSASILVFSRQEKYVRSISLKAVSVTSPNAMFLDKKRDQIYVSDAASRQIVVVDLHGGIVRKIGGVGEENGLFNLPVALAVNSKGNLIAADAFSASIQVFDETGKFLYKFGKRGDTPGDFQLIKSLAVDSSNNIYVVDGRAHNISIFNEQGELLLVLGAFYSTSETGKTAPGGFAVPIGIDIDSTDKIYVVDQMNARVQVFQYFSDESHRRPSSPQP